MQITKFGFVNDRKSTDEVDIGKSICVGFSIQFAIYSYLISCSGSKGYCWPSQAKICDKTSVGLSSVQKHLKILEQRQLIEIRKPKKGSSHQSDDYYPLSLDNPEIYRDLATAEPEELPLFISGDLPA